MHVVIRFVVLLAGLVALSGCGDFVLRAYRDPQLLDSHRYELAEQYESVDGIRLCYHERGSGPALLIIPGLGTNIDYWRANVPALAEHFRVLVVDLPGFGKSDKPLDASYELPWIVERLARFMEQKGAPRYSVMGGSMGGHLALLMGLTYPERVEKIIMMGSTGGWEPPGPLLTLGMHTIWFDFVFVDHIRRSWPDIFPRLYRRIDDATRANFRYQMAARADGGYFWPEGIASSRSLRSIFFNTCLHRLPDVRQPVLLIWGEADEVHPPRDAVKMWKRIPDARVVILADAAHEVMSDRAADFNATVTAFLMHGTAAVENQVAPHLVESEKAGGRMLIQHDSSASFLLDGLVPSLPR